MLEIKNLHVTVENKDIVKGVSLTIKPGEIHALMGPNGSGKSSLAMAVLGHPRYEIRDKGQGLRAKGKNTKSAVELDGEDIMDKTPDERARTGLFLAMQYPVGVAGVTVEQLLRRSVQERKDQILTPMKGSDPYKIDVLRFRKDLEKLAKKVGVKPELIRRSLNVGFSGGEKKRLEILQMLVLKPKYAILDETDSGLDIDALRTIAAAVKNYVSARSTRLVARGNQRLATSHEPPAVLVITHYARLLHHLKPDFVHIMKEGKITETGGKELAERIEKTGYRLAG